MSQSQATPAHRNAAILAAEALFHDRAADIVSVVMRRAHGGDPVCLRLCLERALPAGRLPPERNRRARRLLSWLMPGAPASAPEAAVASGAR